MTTVKEVDMSVKLTPRKKLFVETAAEMFGNGSTINKEQTRVAADKAGVPFPNLVQEVQGGIQYVQASKLDIPAFVADTVAPAVVTPEPDAVMNLVASNMEKQNLVPAPFEGFVPWGNYSNLKKIVKSGMFYPVFITGLSGNGKTLMVEQFVLNLVKS